MHSLLSSHSRCLSLSLHACLRQVQIPRNCVALLITARLQCSAVAASRVPHLKICPKPENRIAAPAIGFLHPNIFQLLFLLSAQKPSRIIKQQSLLSLSLPLSPRLHIRCCHQRRGLLWQTKRLRRLLLSTTLALAPSALLLLADGFALSIVQPSLAIASAIAGDRLPRPS